MMISGLQDGSFISRNILINDSKTGLQIQATKDNYQNVSVTGNNNSIYLQKWKNTVAFTAKISEVPNVEFRSIYCFNQRSLQQWYYQHVWNHTGNLSGLYLVRYVVNGTVNVKNVIIL